MAAIVGHATSSSVRLWLRTGRPGAFSLPLYRREGGLAPSPDSDRALRGALAAAPLVASDLKALLAPVRRENFKIEDYDADTTRSISAISRRTRATATLSTTATTGA